VVIWLRIYPTGDVVGYLFGVSAPTVSRIQSRVLPLLEQAGRDIMRLPAPGRKRRRQWSELLHMIPELSVVVDTFEQAVQRAQPTLFTNTSSPSFTELASDTVRLLTMQGTDGADLPCKLSGFGTSPASHP
jgi:hypothetical protein